MAKVRQKIKTYRIGVWEEKGGYITIKAKTKKEAIDLADKHIEDYGLESAGGHYGLEVTHRDTSVFKEDIKIIK